MADFSLLLLASTSSVEANATIEMIEKILYVQSTASTNESQAAYLACVAFLDFFQFFRESINIQFVFLHLRFIHVQFGHQALKKKKQTNKQCYFQLSANECEKRFSK